MNWQILQFCLGAVFLLCAVLTFYLKRNVGWVGAIRVSLLVFSAFALLFVVSMFLASLEKINALFYQFTLLLTLSISVVLTIYTTLLWIRFFLIHRKAGQISADISHTDFELGWVFGLIILIPSLYLLFDTSTISILDYLLLITAYLYLINGIRSTQYRQNGIIYKGRFIPWDSIDSLSWKTEYSNEMLNLHLKSSSAVIPLKLTFELRKNILDFIKLKLPTQFMRLNPSNSPAEFSQPINPLTNQPTS